MSTTPSQYMSLPVPTVSEDPGPTWASDINDSLIAIDQHDHSSGKGTQVTPAGLNVNADLPFNSKNCTGLRSAKFAVQGAPLSTGSDVGCVYVSGVDLYYNDENGNHVRLTASGGVAGTPGSIGSLVSPASASYSAASTKFVFQSNTNVAADVDGGSVIIREKIASANAVTLNSPTSLSVSYGLTLPAALPASQKILTVDATGAIADAYDADNSTLEVSSNVLRVKALGIGAGQLAADAVTTAKILDGNVTQAKRVALGQQVSNSCDSFQTNSISPSDVTNLTVTITPTGRPIFVALIPDPALVSSTPGYILVQGLPGSTNFDDGRILFWRDSTLFANFRINNTSSTTPNRTLLCAPSWFSVDTGATAGVSQVYKVQAALISGTMLYIYGLKLIAFEL